MSYLTSGGISNIETNLATSSLSGSIKKRGPTGPRGHTGHIGAAGVPGVPGARGEQGPVGPVLSIGFDGGNSRSVYSSGPVFDCGRAE